MTDNNDKDRKPEGSRPGGGTLTLKRPSIEQSKVKQSFGAGRSKTVVVETKRKRLGDDKPVGAEARPAFQPPPPRITPAPPSNTQTPAPPKPQATQRSGVVLRTLTAEEKEARDRALAGARVREAEDRKRQEEDAKRRAEQEEHDQKEREAAARRKADEEARHKTEEDARRKADEAARKLQPKQAAASNVVTPATVPMKPVTGKAAATPVKRTHDEEEAPRRTFPGVVKREVKAPVPARTKGEADKRRGRLSVVNALNEDDERARSVAAFRRRTERLKKQVQGFQMPTEKASREVVIPEAITIQELANRMAERAVDIIKFLMKQGEMHTINDVIDADTAQLVAEEMGHKVKRRRGGCARAAEIPSARGHDHGARRSRQDVAPRCPAQDQCGVRRSGWNHPAHRRLSGRYAEWRRHLHRHARPRGVHLDARARRQGHRHRGAGRRRR